MRLENSTFSPVEDLLEEGDLYRAVESYPPLLAANPGHPAAHHNFAMLLRKLGRTEEAIEQSKIAYELSPDNPTIIFSFGLSQEQGGFLPEAEWCYRQSLNLRPFYTAALNNLGRLLVQMERPVEAHPLLERAHQVAPDDTNVSLNLANACISLGRPTDAENYIQEPQSAAALNTLGIAKYVQRDWVSAEDLFQRAVKADTDFAGAHENLALVLLHLEKFEEGWLQYDWRWRNCANQLTKRVFDKPLWDGTHLGGKSLLLHSEQGFGDTIQFVRYASLIEKNGGKIFLACQEELTDLLQEVPGVDEVFVLGQNLPSFDCHAPLLNLAGLMGTVPKKIPVFDSYLNVSDDIYPSKIGVGALKIGICWIGRPRHLHDPYRNRSCPVNSFNLIAQLSGVEIYSLQVEQPVKKDTLSFNLIEPKAPISNFLQTADAISALDLVVSVDTAVIHLTGALGKPGIVVLSYAADWRWGDGNGTAPWYPSIQMIRQPAPGKWDDVFQQVSEIIKVKYLS